MREPALPDVWAAALDVLDAVKEDFGVVVGIVEEEDEALEVVEELTELVEVEAEEVLIMVEEDSMAEDAVEA